MSFELPNEFSQREYPYRKPNAVTIVEVPENISRPETLNDIVNTTSHIYEADTFLPQTLLPPQYNTLMKFFREQYEACYRSKSIDISPRALDYAFQQFAIKNDEAKGRNGFNTFGLFTLSYLEGLGTIKDGMDKYFQNAGRRYDEELSWQEPRSLLLGSSSISTAQEFRDFIKAINPDAEASVIDIDPVAVALAKKVEGVFAIQADAQEIPLEAEKYDFVATNFLVNNLIDAKGSGVETLSTIMREVARLLKPKGRFVMIEQLWRTDLEWVNHYAHENGLCLQGEGGPEGGINRKAKLLKNRNDIGRVIGGISDFVSSDEAYKGQNLYDYNYDFRKHKLHTEEATCLIFGKEK